MRATGGEGLPLASRGWDPQHSNKDVRVGDQGGHRAVMMGRAPTAYTIMLLRKVSEQASCKRGLRSQKKWGTWLWAQNDRQVCNMVCGSGHF